MPDIINFELEDGIEALENARKFTVSASKPALYFVFETKSTAIMFDYEGEHDLVSEVGYWQLYYDIGHGFSDGACIKFQTEGKDVKVRCIIQSANGFKRFKLMPCNVPGTIEIRKLRIEPLNRYIAQAQNFLAIVANAIEFRGGGIKGTYKLAKDITKKGLSHYLFGALNASKSVSALKSQTEGASLIARGGVGSYDHWIKLSASTKTDEKSSRELSRALTVRPKISIMMPTYNSDIPSLKKALNSVRDQYYDNWELIICDDGSTNQAHLAVIKEYVEKNDSIQFLGSHENAGIAATTNRCIAAAKGDYVGFLDHDDVLALHALFACALALNHNPEIDWIYSDEDKTDEDDKRYGPYFKPDWSPVFLMSCMYTCHFSVYRKSIGDQIGWLRPEFDQAQDYDFALRFSRQTNKVHHIPDILYSWRALETSTASGADAKPEAQLRARRAVEDHVNHLPVSGKVVDGPFVGSHRVIFDHPSDVNISVVIPTAGNKQESSYLVQDLIESIRGKSKGFIVEYVVSVNPGCPTDLLDWLAETGVNIVRHKPTTPFNLAVKINQVVEAASNECVLLLNDDMEPLNDDWLSELYGYYQLDHVCAVGAKLLFKNKTVQHAGVTLLKQGPSHLYYGAPADAIGLVGFTASPRESIAVTGACIMMSKLNYLAIGGFSPDFRVNYNDVDFCLRLLEYTDQEIIYNPNAVMLHYESISREAPPANELVRFNEKWRYLTGRDPYYNINLSQSSAHHEIGSDYRTYAERYLSLENIENLHEV